uniref:Uncharacterized protein n=1 Tax=Tetradesmus obliquus TaxID=3088 RepID=A0A383VIK8_TETOB
MSESFNKSEAKQRCQLLLQRPGTTVSLQSSDGAVLMQLLQRHHNAAQKTGCGISHFTVQCSSVGGFKPAPHFVLHRKDGSSTDFSYNKCINSKPAVAAAAAAAPAAARTSSISSSTPDISSSSSWELHDQFRYEALRKAVRSQTWGVKNAALGRCGAPKCPITGATLT